MNAVSLTFFKTCSKCGCTKPATLEFFFTCRRGKYGLSWECRVCNKVDARAYYQRNREKLKKKRYDWVAANKEAAKEQRLRYQKNNPEKMAEWYRTSYLRNREKIREDQKLYYQQNKGMFAGHRRAYRARRSKVEHKSYNDVDLNVMWHEQHGCCFYCRMPLFAMYDIEHKTPISRGGPDKLENIALACSSCNSRKHTKTEAEFREVLTNEAI